MLSRDDLVGLLERAESPRGSILSVYLDTDQSRAINIDRGFEIVLKDLLREIKQDLDKERRREFDKAAERAQKFVEDYRDLRRGLIVFCDGSDAFFWDRALNVRVRSDARWNEEPHVRPIFEILDEYERYAVILTDRGHARIFTVYQGEIEERREAFAEADVSHHKSAGLDRLLSQLNNEGKADIHAHWHLKKVADITSHLANVHEFDRLILAGPYEVTSHLYGLLPERLRSRVVRQISLSVKDNKAFVLEETLKVAYEVERESEARKVEELITAAAKHQKAVVKLGVTLRALQEWRVWQLVYAEGFAPAGSQCTNCRALFAELKDTCDYCGKQVREISDLIEQADKRVLESDGKIEQVQGNAALRLQEVGSIGAFLRY